MAGGWGYTPAMVCLSPTRRRYSPYPKIGNALRSFPDVCLRRIGYPQHIEPQDTERNTPMKKRITTALAALLVALAFSIGFFDSFATAAKKGTDPGVMAVRKP
jgi:hypothetical protein